MNLLKLLRPSKSPVANVLSSTVRGAKRKGEKKDAGVLTEHILNIYKNAEDVQILPDEYYPEWVFDLARPSMKLEEFYGNAITGTSVPHATDQFTMIKKWRRQYNYKLQNRLKLSRAPYDLKMDDAPEGDEPQLDIEMGVLPEVIQQIAKEEAKKLEAQEGGQSGGGGGGGAKEKPPSEG